MSYILDALKKAERDRLREDPQELDDFASSSWDPYEQKPSSDTFKYLVLLVAVVALLVALVIYSESFKSQSQSASDTVQISSSNADIKPVSKPPEQAEAPPISTPIIVQASTPIPLPELVISGHMFIAEGSASNRLFAGNRSFRHGDKIDSHWTLESIGLEGIEIRSGERLEALLYR